MLANSVPISKAFMCDWYEHVRVLICVKELHGWDEKIFFKWLFPTRVHL